MIEFKEHSETYTARLKAENAQQAERIEALETAQRWVPVGDGLPDAVEVLAVDQDGSMYLDVCGTSGKFTIEFPVEIGISITHWMPLPLPPQQEESSGE